MHVGNWRQLLVLGAIALSISGGAGEAKTPGKTYCFLGVCHRVKSLDETRNLVGKLVPLMASHYDDPKFDRFNPSNLTSSGAYFHANRPDNAASPIYPNGTVLLVWNPQSRKAVVVRIDNAGPYFKDRKLDLSKAAAHQLGFGRQGVARVQTMIIKAPSPAEARYRRGRVYAPVAGYIGTHPSIQVAAMRAGGPPVEDRPSILVASAPPIPVLRPNRPVIAVPVRKPFAFAVLARLEKQGSAERKKDGIGTFPLREPLTSDHRSEEIESRIEPSTTMNLSALSSLLDNHLERGKRFSQLGTGEFFTGEYRGSRRSMRSRDRSHALTRLAQYTQANMGASTWQLPSGITANQTSGTDGVKSVSPRFTGANSVSSPAGE